MTKFRMTIEMNEDLIGYITVAGKCQMNAIKRYLKKFYGVNQASVVKYSQSEYSALAMIDGNQEYFEFFINKE